MKILITSIVDLRKTAPNRLHHFIKYLSKKHEITAVCINDWWKAKLVDTSKYYQDFIRIFDNIEIKYITEKRISPFKQEFFSPKLMQLKNDFDDFDVIFNYNTLISGYYASKELKLPIVYDLADDLPEMIANSPQIPRVLRLFGKLVGQYMLKKNVTISRKITSISKILQDSYFIPSGKFELVPNGVDTKLFRRVKSNIKAELWLEDYFVLGYVGVLREWVDLRPVYQAIRNLNDVKLLIVGEEGMLSENKELIRRYRVEDKVIFAGTVPYTKVPLYISAMDVCLIPFKQNAISQNAVPLKLFEYMACEKPVISADLKGVREAVGDRVLYANTEQEYKDCIKTLISSPEFANELGKRGRDFVVENYEWSKIAEKLEEIIGGVVFENISTKPAF